MHPTIIVYITIVYIRLTLNLNLKEKKKTATHIWFLIVLRVDGNLSS